MHNVQSSTFVSDSVALSLHGMSKGLGHKFKLCLSGLSNKRYTRYLDHVSGRVHVKHFLKCRFIIYNIIIDFIGYTC